MARLRIGTFNLLHGLSLPPSAAQPVADDEALRTAVAALDTDLLGLQEVDRDQPRSGGVDQAALAAAALGAEHWRFLPTLVGTPGDPAGWVPARDGAARPGGPSYGIALVSRLPVRSWHFRRLTASRRSIPLLVPAPNSPDGPRGRRRPQVLRVPDEPRAALAAVVEGPAGPFTVVTTHLSFVPWHTSRQLRALSRWARTLPQPVLLTGDLNLPGALVRRLPGWRDLAPLPTYPGPRPRVQLDHLLAHGLPTGTPARAQAWPLPVSDHRALTVDLPADHLTAA